MLYRFLLAQLNNPCRGDWTSKVQEDLTELNINLTLEEIRRMKKALFIKLVKEKVAEYTFKVLLEQKAGHSKMGNLEYDDFEAQPYLKDEDITTEMAHNIFKFRTKMLNIKENFKGTEETTECPLCKKHLDSQSEIEKCEELSRYIKNVDECKKLYKDSSNVDAAKILANVIEHRESYLNTDEEENQE